MQHTNACITRVNACARTDTAACKCRHATCSETHMGTHMHVLTQIQAHTHDLLKAAPWAYGRAKRNKFTRPGAVPRAAVAGPVLPSFPSEGWVSVCGQSRSVKHSYNIHRHAHRLPYPTVHLSAAICACPAATPPFLLILYLHTALHINVSFSKEYTFTFYSQDTLTEPP